MKFDKSMLFSPSRQSGVALRHILNDSFASSFEHIFRACESHVSFPAARVSALLARMRGGSREAPYLYALHFKLIDAIQDDRLDDVETLISTICDLTPVTGEPLITDLRPDVFPWDADTVAWYFDEEHASVFRYGAPPDDLLPDRRAQVSDALDLLGQAAPGLKAEFDELMTAVILARRVNLDQSAQADTFGGSSALRAFGGFLLNVEMEPSIVHCAVSLAHEHAHNLLFALSPKEGVVENPEHDLFSSPLRDDARPLEGIFHATFVLSRMVYSLARIRASGRLPAHGERTAASLQEEYTGLFFDGLKTVQQHGRLTAQGSVALEAAEQFMAVQVQDAAPG